MRHRIELRAFGADELRAIVWDDEAGSVSGDHEVVPDIAAALAEPEALIRTPWGGVRVRGHARNAADFLAVLYQLTGFGFAPPPQLRLRLPEALAAVQPTTVPVPADIHDPRVRY